MSISGLNSGKPVRLVIDTNVWLDWLVFDDRSTAALTELANAGTLDCLSSPPMRSEWNHVLARSAIAPLLSRISPSTDVAISRLSARYDELTRLVPAPVPHAAWNRLLCTDPDDQVFLDLAIENRSQYLISRDRALLKLARRAKLQFDLLIVTPIRFSELLQSGILTSSNDNQAIQ